DSRPGGGAVREPGEKGEQRPGRGAAEEGREGDGRRADGAVHGRDLERETGEGDGEHPDHHAGGCGEEEGGRGADRSDPSAGRALPRICSGAGREWGGEGEVRHDVLRDLEGRIGSRWLSSTLRSRRVPAAEPPVPGRAGHLSCPLLRGAARSARSDLLELALLAPPLRRSEE